MTSRDGDAETTLAMDLAVAIAATRSACALIEENAAVSSSVSDALTLGRVYADLLTIRSAVVGAAARLRYIEKLVEERADTLPAPAPGASHLRLVK